jgi:4-hydroxybenzoate polyprenyltransferase
LVLGIALVARASLPIAATLAVSMLGIQFCIGAVNDLFDEELDARSKPRKPIPARLVSRREATAIAIAAGAIGLGIAALVRQFDPLLLLMAAVMLGAGLVYDAWLKPTNLGWVCFAVAFPILPVFAWYGVTGMLPPRWEVLLPTAILAGPALQLANGLVDYSTDRAAGVRTLPVALGPTVSLVVMSALLLTIHALAWVTLVPSATPFGTSSAIVLMGVAAALAIAGIGFSARLQSQARELGWRMQAASIAVLAGSWLLAAAGS